MVRNILNTAIYREEDDCIGDEELYKHLYGENWETELDKKYKRLSAPPVEIKNNIPEVIQRMINLFC